MTKLAFWIVLVVAAYAVTTAAVVGNPTTPHALHAERACARGGTPSC